MQFTPEQLQIIEHQQGHAKVIAVAGAGKTTTLAQFVAHKIDANISPKRMLVIMYNKSAQLDFSQKLSKVMGGRPLPQVRTFHGLALKIYQSLISMGHLPAFQGELIADSEQEIQLWRLMQQCADKQTAQDILNDRKKWLDPMMAFMEQVKSTLDPAKLVFKQQKLPAQCGFFVKVFERFERWRKQQKRISYSDMLYDPCILFSDRPDIAQQFANHMAWIVVDEYQDINPIQQFLLQVLAGNKANVMAIGDPDQTIYEYRGSDGDFLLSHFDQHFQQAIQYNLTTSFRYGHKVALLANQHIQQNRQRLDVISVAHDQNPDTHVEYHHDVDEVTRTLQLIRQAMEHYAPEQVCILYRLWGMSAPMELALLQENIPYQMAHQNWVLERHELQPFIFIFEMAANVFNERSDYQKYQGWLLFLTLPALKIKRSELEALAKELASKKNPLRHFSKMDFKELSHWQKQQLENRLGLVKILTDKRLMAYQVVNRFIRETDYYKGLADSAFSKQAVDDRKATVSGFLRFLNSIKLKAKDAHDYFAQLKQKKLSQQTKAGIVLSSIHRSKGLEWPVVIMPSISATYYPYQAEGELQQKASIESERRLFYVAMTRAQHALHLVSNRLQGKDDVSPFIAHMKPNYLRRFHQQWQREQPQELSLPKGLIAMAQRYAQAQNWSLQLREQVVKVDKALAPKQNKNSSATQLQHGKFGVGTLEKETRDHWHVKFDDGQVRILDKQVAGAMVSFLSP